jgi:hypothetical protein
MMLTATMNNMNTISLIGSIGAGMGFVMVGISMKRTMPLKNWKAFLIGGITMIVLGSIGLLLKL